MTGKHTCFSKWKIQSSESIGLAGLTGKLRKPYLCAAAIYADKIQKPTGSSERWACIIIEQRKWYDL